MDAVAGHSAVLQRFRRRRYIHQHSLGRDYDNIVQIDAGSEQRPDWFWDMMTGNTGSGGAPVVQQPVDERYHYKVALGYKDTLILAEQERKGLVGADKVAELEVDA